MRVLLLLLFCKLLFAATIEETIHEYQEQIDNFLLDLNYKEAIATIEEFKLMYPDNPEFDELLTSLKEMSRAKNQEREVVQVKELPEEEVIVEQAPLLRRPIFYKLSEPFFELSSGIGLRSSGNDQKNSRLDYFSFLETAFFPFGEGDNFGFSLSYNGRQFMMHEQERLLAVNILETSLLLRFLLFSNQERGALSLRTFFNFGLLFVPSTSSFIESNLIFTVGTSLRGAPLYVIFNFETFDRLYSTLELKFSLSGESNNYASLAILFALMYRFDQFLIGPYYLFQSQSWNKEQLSSHNFGLRLEFYFDRENSLTNKN